MSFCRAKRGIRFWLRTPNRAVRPVEILVGILHSG